MASPAIGYCTRSTTEWPEASGQRAVIPECPAAPVPALLRPRRTGAVPEATRARSCNVFHDRMIPRDQSFRTMPSSVAADPADAGGGCVAGNTSFTGEEQRRRCRPGKAGRPWGKPARGWLDPADQPAPVPRSGRRARDASGPSSNRPAGSRRGGVLKPGPNRPAAEIATAWCPTRATGRH
jgi:hypothetical protein